MRVKLIPFVFLFTIIVFFIIFYNFVLCLQRDLFIISAVDLGDLTKVIVGHDGKGMGSGWYLEKIVVQEGLFGRREFHFPCDK